MDDRVTPARRAAEEIGARAFAEGERVAFAPGELDLSSRDGVHLAARELANATRHSSGRSDEWATLVHAELSGTALAAEQAGGARRGPPAAVEGARQDRRVDRLLAEGERREGASPGGGPTAYDGPPLPRRQRR